MHFCLLDPKLTFSIITRVTLRKIMLRGVSNIIKPTIVFLQAHTLRSLLQKQNTRSNIYRMSKRNHKKQAMILLKYADQLKNNWATSTNLYYNYVK